jgi:cysteine synthase A
VEASFVPGVLDAMVKVPDRWSVGAMRALSARLGRPVGPSTGTNLVAALLCAQHMQHQGAQGSVVTLLCDDGQRYQETCFDAGWRVQHGLDCDAETAALQAWMDEGRWPAGLGGDCRCAGALADADRG